DGREIVRGDGFAIYDNDRWLGFELGAGGGAAPSGSVLFGEDPGLQSGKSLLFEEHYRGAENPGGHRFGIRADQNEAGLYDYASNHLVAKYIRGLMPSDEYLDEEGNTICVKVRKELVGPNMPTQKNVKWLPL
ncbi:MAG: hypothetical protein OEW00_13565, partial [candidate division Zixibacteria bacterium]|nr:hypothetical protein [candidate division Zixibacteria bacterium]